MNGTQQSAFEQFRRKPPANVDLKIALALAADFLEKKGLKNTLQVLGDEAGPLSTEEMENLLKKLPDGPSSLARVVSAAGH
jgi:hypothetical protein